MRKSTEPRAPENIQMLRIKNINRSNTLCKQEFKGFLPSSYCKIYKNVLIKHVMMYANLFSCAQQLIAKGACTTYCKKHKTMMGKCVFRNFLCIFNVQKYIGALKCIFLKCSLPFWIHGFQNRLPFIQSMGNHFKHQRVLQYQLFQLLRFYRGLYTLLLNSNMCSFFSIVLWINI